MEIYKNLQLEDLDGEIWKEIEGYDGDYFISNLGRVKSFIEHNGTSIRILKQSKNNNKYLTVGLYKNKKGKNKYTHILMFETFNNYKLKENECIHHIDFTKDNYLDNFKLMTIEEHTILHHKGRTVLEKTKKLISKKTSDKNNPMFGKHHSKEFKQKHSKRMRYENNPNSVLTEQNVIEIRKYLNEGILTQKEIARMFGVSKTTISYIKHRKIWKHIKGDS